MMFQSSPVGQAAHLSLPRSLRQAVTRTQEASRGASVAIGASLRSTRSACAAVVHLVREMRSKGRRLDFLGLTGTMLGDGETRSLADALNALPASGPAAKAETIELKQVHLSEPGRDQLTKAGTRAGVEVLLSRINGPALRIR